eukprot:XP_025002332.1 basic proline-rich protein-like isoform X2 [Gallus gallus]
MVSGSSVPPPVASPRMRAAPRRKRGRTGAVLRTAAPEVCGRTAPCRGEEPSAARIPPPSPPLPSAPLGRGMRGFGTAEGLGAPTAAALLPASGPGPPEPPALLPVPPGAEEPGSGTAARLAALQLSSEVEDVAVKEESLTGPPSPSQDPHSPLMRNLAAIHISGWASSCAPMPALKRGE